MNEESIKPKFSDNFWDEKLNGYLVLYQNVRNSLTNVKEFELFLREVVSIEEQYIKQMNKCSLQVQKFMPDSTITPIWTGVLKEINDNNSYSHSYFTKRIYELIKQVQIYLEELKKKKKKLKESEFKTVQLIDVFRNIKPQLARSKEQCLQLKSELEKFSKTSQNNLNLMLNTNYQKLEKKLQISIDDYKLTIERYNLIRDEFEAKFTSSCNLFQEYEESHLNKMRDFVKIYLKLINQLNTSRTKNSDESEKKLDLSTTDRLLDQFMLNKSTGQYRPAKADFVLLETGLNLKKQTSLSISLENLDHNNRPQQQQQETNSKVLNFLTNIDFISKIKSNSNIPKEQNKTSTFINQTSALIPDLEIDQQVSKPKHLYNYVKNMAKNPNPKKTRLSSDPSLELINPLKDLEDTKTKSQDSVQNVDSLLTATSFDEENFKKIHDSDLEQEFSNLNKFNSTLNKDQADMTNLYDLSEEEFRNEQEKAWKIKRLNDTDNDLEHEMDSSSDEEDDSDDSDLPKKIVLRIKPISELDRNQTTASPDVLNLISKNLQLKTTSTPKRRSFKNSRLHKSGVGSNLNTQFSANSNIVDENNNKVLNSTPPPLPPLPAKFQLKKLNAINEINKSLNDDSSIMQF